METVETYETNISKCKSNEIASDLIVAVMTVCANIGSNIKLSKIFEKFNIKDPIKIDKYTIYWKDPNNKKDIKNKNKEENCFILQFVPNTKKSKDGHKNKAFYNCLSAEFYVEENNNKEKKMSKISSKIFPNGSIQLPGCRSIYTVYKAPEILLKFLKIINIEYGMLENDNIKINDLRIVMINSNFVFQENGERKNILQEKLKNLINNNIYKGIDEPNKVWRIATFQPEKYAGVNIKYLTKKTRDEYVDYFKNKENNKIGKLDGQISIFIFRSGKGTITAAKNSLDLLEAYQEICKFVKNNKKEVFN